MHGLLHVIFEDSSCLSHIYQRKVRAIPERMSEARVSDRLHSPIPGVHDWHVRVETLAFVRFVKMHRKMEDAQALVPRSLLVRERTKHLAYAS
jgi:hypothetical protein